MEGAGSTTSLLSTGSAKRSVIFYLEGGGGPRKLEEIRYIFFDQKILFKLKRVEHLQFLKKIFLFNISDSRKRDC